jgi:hypothetical protein
MVVENETIREIVTMLIDYDFLPIQCKFCLKIISSNEGLFELG